MARNGRLEGDHVDEHSTEIGGIVVGLVKPLRAALGNDVHTASDSAYGGVVERGEVGDPIGLEEIERRLGVGLKRGAPTNGDKTFAKCGSRCPCLRKGWREPTVA